MLWFLKLLLISLNYLSVTSVKVQPKIVGGRVVVNGEFPYQVSLRIKQYETTYGKGHFCGGTLISNNTVLTAAHCLYNNYSLWSAKDMLVVAGEVQLFKKTKHTLQLPVKQTKSHEHFNSTTMENDIGIIFLGQDIPANHKTAKWVDLKKVHQQSAETVRDYNCTVSGWGRITSDNPILSSKLKAVNISLVNEVPCNETYTGILKQGMICAGGVEGEDSCQGDSGGPMICNNTLTGIVSFGISTCAVEGNPGVYTEVYYYLPWIQNLEAKKQPNSVANISAPLLFIILTQFLFFI